MTVKPATKRFHMRDKNLLQLFLILNVALAACFVVYLFLSSNRQPKVTSASFGAVPKTNSAPRLPDRPLRPVDVDSSSNSVTEVATNLPGVTNQIVPKPVFTQKQFGWEQLEKDEVNKTEEYRTYLDSLRAVGCPENKVRYIILADINELFAKKRVKEAVTHDLQWWRAEPEISVATVLQERGRTLEEQRRELIEKYLGSDVAESEGGEARPWR